MSPTYNQVLAPQIDLPPLDEAKVAFISPTERTLLHQEISQALQQQQYTGELSFEVRLDNDSNREAALLVDASHLNATITIDEYDRINIRENSGMWEVRVFSDGDLQVTNSTGSEVEVSASVRGPSVFMDRISSATVASLLPGSRNTVPQDTTGAHYELDLREPVSISVDIRPLGWPDR